MDGGFFLLAQRRGHKEEHGLLGLQDVRDLVAANDVKLLNDEGANVDKKELLELLDAVADKTLNSSSIRWWIGASEDGRMQLQLQAAPSPATGYISKPAWKG